MNNMDSSSSSKNKYIIWIDKNVNNEENQGYANQLKNENYILETYTDIESGLKKFLYNKEEDKNKEKKIHFKDIYLILSGSFYQDFILKFKEHLKDIYIVPKIVIFTSNKEFLEKNAKIKDIIENKFYNLGGIQTLFKDVYEKFLIEKTWKKEIKIENISLNNDIKGEQYTFEYINNILELYLPVFYKSFFKLNEKDNFDELTHYLYDKYKEKQKIKELLESIDGIPEIPIQILGKYYARLYTLQSDFYKDLNKGFRKGNLLLKEEELLFLLNNKYYNTFMKAFYEGIKLGAFGLDLKKKLYRFSCLEKKEIDKIKEYIKNKKPGIPAAIFFSKAFLSFSEKEKISYNFFNKYRDNKKEYHNENKVPVFFHLIKKEDIKESLYSHIRIDNLSDFPDEKEVLFLPFSCFEILEVTLDEKETKNNSKDIYRIELTYLGKYEKELKKIVKEEKEKIIPNTNFKQSLEGSKIIDTNQDITTKSVVDRFSEYEKTFDKNNADIYVIFDVKEEDRDRNHYVLVFGRNYDKKGTDFVKENKDKIKIIINNEEKDLEYKYELKKGYNKIEIKLISEEIVNLQYMFYGCTSLKSIEGLKNFYTKNIKNFSFMFWGCKSLSDISALENWDVSNGNNFRGMFERCNSLSNVKALENWNVSNGNNFSTMFCDCRALSDVKPLENWNVSNGTNFDSMFRECKSLSDIKPLKNWNVSNGNNFEDMFSGCDSLLERTPIESWNTHGYNPNLMFGN